MKNRIDKPKGRVGLAGINVGIKTQKEKSHPARKKKMQGREGKES